MAAALDPSGLTALCIFMMIVSTLAVILRVWSRLTQKEQNFWWDDWCAIASLVCVQTTQSYLMSRSTNAPVAPSTHFLICVTSIDLHQPRPS